MKFTITENILVALITYTIILSLFSANSEDIIDKITSVGLLAGCLYFMALLVISRNKREHEEKYHKAIKK